MAGFLPVLFHFIPNDILTYFYALNRPYLGELTGDLFLRRILYFFACEFKLLPQSTCDRTLVSKGRGSLCIFALPVSLVSDWTGTGQPHLVSRNVESLCLGSHLPFFHLHRVRGWDSLFEMTLETWAYFAGFCSKINYLRIFLDIVTLNSHNSGCLAQNAVTLGCCLKFLLITDLLAVGLCESPPYQCGPPTWFRI